MAESATATYKRACRLAENRNNKVFRDSIKPYWLPDQQHLCYQVQTGSQIWSYVKVDLKTGVSCPAFDHSKLAQALINAGRKEVDAANLKLQSCEWKSLELMEFRRSGCVYEVNLETYNLKMLDCSSGHANRLDKIPGVGGEGGDKSSIDFVNQTDEKVSIFWLNVDGKRTFYLGLDAGSRREQSSYEGHVWLAVDSRGEDICAFVVMAESEDAIIQRTDKGNGVAVEQTPLVREEETRSMEAALESTKIEPLVIQEDQYIQKATEDDTKEGASTWQAKIKDHNVTLIDEKSGQVHTTTQDGTSEYGYSEVLGRSPDGRYFVVTYVKNMTVQQVTFIESSPKDQIQPKVHTNSYAKPGDDLETINLVLVDAETRSTTTIDESLFPNPWCVHPRLHSFEWKGDSSQFYFHYYKRGHKLIRLISVDVKTKVTRVVIEETSDTFLYHNENFYYKLLTHTDELIWMSERSGWNHLYLYNSTTGKVKNHITSGEWRIYYIEQVSEEKRQIWFFACGLHRDQDPYYLHLCRINFDGSGMVILTEGDGTHSVQWSPDERYFIDTWSRVDKPPVIELRNADDGKLICVLEEADISALKDSGWRAPIPFSTKGRDGTTDIYGVIQFPSKYTPGMSYPVLDDIYAGPHCYRTPKKFATHYNFQTMAELGFIVVVVDGMGTSSRSKVFHDICWQDLADAGLPDHKLFLKAAADKYTEIDLSRVGIYGSSAGGQNSMRALLDHGDVYKVAVSDCGCHDNRMDKLWWNEQWLGWPVDEQVYDKNSNVVHAHRLPDNAKLLLIVGEMDTNVDPASTMQVANALVKADKDFDMIVVPGVGHGCLHHSWVKKRIADFLMTHLQGRSIRRSIL